MASGPITFALQWLHDLSWDCSEAADGAAQREAVDNARHELKALRGRLRAAEAVCKEAETVPASTWPLIKALAKWREASGK